MSGSMGDVTWNYKPMPLRFFDGKGVVEELLEQMRIPKVRFRAAEGEGYAFLQPGRCAEVLSGGTVLGWVGEIHPDARDVYGIDIPVVAFELNLEALLKLSGAQEPIASSRSSRASSTTSPSWSTRTSRPRRSSSASPPPAASCCATCACSTSTATTSASVRARSRWRLAHLPRRRPHAHE